MDIATVVGFALTITLFLMAMLDGGTIDTFVNVPSLLIVVGGTLGLTLISFPLQDVIKSSKYFAYAFVPPKPGGDRDTIIDDLEKGIFMFKRIKSYAMACGWAGVLVGAVFILAHFDDPAAIGPAAAIMLLTALYGILIGYEFFVPVSTKLQVHLDELKKAA